MKTKFQQKYERFLASSGKKPAAAVEHRTSTAQAIEDYESILLQSRQRMEESANTFDMVKYLSGIPSSASTRSQAQFRAESMESMDSEVAKYVTEGAKRFWELAGLEYGPTPSSQKWESEENAPAQGSWKKLLTEKPFSVDGHKFEAGAHEDAAREALKIALRANSLPVEGGEDREVSPDEFAFRGVHTGPGGNAAFAHFQHKGTRNHVHLDLGSATLVIPHTDAPFHRGFFGTQADESAMREFRNLAGLME